MKAQTSLEYLMSYSWLIVIVIIIGGAIYLYFPSSDNYDISKTTELSFENYPLGIEDHILKSNGEFSLVLINRENRAKRITKVVINGVEFPFNTIVDEGGKVTISANSTLLNGTVGNEYRYNITIFYTNPSGLEHKEFGIFAGYYIGAPTQISSDEHVGEIREITNLNSSWKYVEFLRSYNNPVIVCTYNLLSKTNPQAVIRIKDINSTSFMIKAQNPSNQVMSNSKAYCLIIEEGTYNASGLLFEAHRFSSDMTNRKGDWNIYHYRPYGNTYTNPVVFGQVMSYNDSRWSVFWDSSSSRSNPPSASYLNIGKHVGEDSVHTRNQEMLGYIVFESGEWDLNGVHIKVTLSSDSVKGTGNNPPYSFSLGGSYVAGIVTQSAMDGGDGSWAVLYGTNPIGTTINVAVDEDTIGDSERRHTTEQVAYIVFNQTGLI